MGRIQKRLSVDEYVKGILEGDRIILSRAITVIESTHKEDENLTSEILQKILPYTGKSIRIGLTGAPGVGKSTFIEAFGREILRDQKKIAVLTIDPSSSKTKGSILGDKTRMSDLSKNPLAFIRPTAAGETLGGTAAKTREVMLLCEAAGFERIIIETVGVGQSETLVKGMVDFFLLLMLPGSGDELQGIKRGIVELADMIVVTKADQDNMDRAKKTSQDFTLAVRVLNSESQNETPVMICSSITNFNIPKVWKKIVERIEGFVNSGVFDEKRKTQATEWMHQLIRMSLLDNFYHQPTLAKAIIKAENDIEEGKTYASSAAKNLLSLYMNHKHIPR